MVAASSFRDFLDAVTAPSAENLGQPDEVERLRDRTRLVDEALQSPATIDQATGVVMAAHRCTRDEASRLLIRMSQDIHVPLRVLAAALVHSAGCRRELLREQPWLTGSNA